MRLPAKGVTVVRGTAGAASVSLSTSDVVRFRVRGVGVVRLNIAEVDVPVAFVLGGGVATFEGEWVSYGPHEPTRADRDLGWRRSDDLREFYATNVTEVST